MSSGKEYGLLPEQRLVIEPNVIVATAVVVCFVVAGGLICFSIRADGDDEFSRKIAELESQRVWILVQKGRVPQYNNEDMPRECSAFVYKVSKN